MTKRKGFMGLFVSILLLQSHLAYAEVAPQQGNAAEWYRRAVSLFQGPDDGLKRGIQRAISRGWTGEDSNLLAYLRRNLEAINLLKQATRIPFCNFGQGQVAVHRLSYGGSKDESLYLFDSLGWFAKTLTAEGCRAVYEGREKDALEDDLSVLRLGHHVGQEPNVSVLGKMMEFGWQKEVYDPMIRLIQRSSLDAEDWRGALADLQTLKAGWIGMEPVVQNDRLFVHAAIEKEFNSEIAKRKTSGQPTNEVTQRAQKVLELLTQLQKEYEEYFLDAYRKDNPEEFDKKAGQFLTDVKKKAQSFNISLNGLEDMNKFLTSDCPAELVAQAALAISLIENSERIIRNFYLGRTRINLIIGAIALRLYEMEHGEAPEKLDQLVPNYLPSLPDDPFVAKGLPLRYTRGEKEWYIFSAGPSKNTAGGGRVPVQTEDKEINPSNLIITRKWTP